MSEESTEAGATPEEETVVDPIASQAAEMAAEQEKLSKKFRLIAGEEVLLTKRPSTFAFLNLYMLGFLVLAIHLIFEFEPGKDNESFFVGLLATIFFSSGAAGLTGVMLFITWMNRLMNVSTSGRWVTLGLLIVSLAPTLVLLDDLIAMTGLLNDNNTGYLPNYNFIIFGGGFVAVYMALVYYYQRSFHYAITSDAIIFEHSFLLSRSHRQFFSIASQKLLLLDLQPAPCLVLRPLRC